MKKIFVIILAVLMLAALGATTFAAESTQSGVAISVSGLKADGGLEAIRGGNSFEDNWNAAVEYACDSKKMKNNGYTRIVVDFYADWNANAEGVFGNGDGFSGDTIAIPADAKMMINMNGHTINRGLTEYRRNGEVLYIGSEADVIINGGKNNDPITKAGEETADIKMGTITGGYSCNGAGGIHIDDEAHVTLNNVKVIGNVVEDDDGAGIAIYDEAILNMNGGSLSDNFADKDYHTPYGAGIYVYSSEANFNNVLIKNNNVRGVICDGVAIFLDGGSKVDLTGCTVEGNGIGDEDEGISTASSIIKVVNYSELSANSTVFKNNGAYYYALSINGREEFASSVIEVEQAPCTIDKCVFEGNSTVFLIDSTSATRLAASNSKFINNNSSVFSGDHFTSGSCYFEKCEFKGNVTPEANGRKLDDFDGIKSVLTLYDCDLGGATFDKSIVNNTTRENRFGSLFAEGSVATVISLTALVIAAVAIVIAFYSKKNKANLLKNGKDAEKAEA